MTSFGSDEWIVESTKRAIDIEIKIWDWEPALLNIDKTGKKGIFSKSLSISVDWNVHCSAKAGTQKSQADKKFWIINEEYELWEKKEE